MFGKTITLDLIKQMLLEGKSNGEAHNIRSVAHELQVSRRVIENLCREENTTFGKLPKKCKYCGEIFTPTNNRQVACEKCKSAKMHPTKHQRQLEKQNTNNTYNVYEARKHWRTLEDVDMDMENMSPKEVIKLLPSYLRIEMRFKYIRELCLNHNSHELAEICGCNPQTIRETCYKMGTTFKKLQYQVRTDKIKELRLSNKEYRKAHFIKDVQEVLNCSKNAISNALLNTEKKTFGYLPVRCPICGEIFTPTHPNQKICSLNCVSRVALWRTKWHQRNNGTNSNYEILLHKGNELHLIQERDKFDGCLCPECGNDHLVVDTERVETYCPVCGLVLEEVPNDENEIPVDDRRENYLNWIQNEIGVEV